jgi:hypothetical protein
MVARQALLTCLAALGFRLVAIERRAGTNHVTLKAARVRRRANEPRPTDDGGPPHNDDASNAAHAHDGLHDGLTVTYTALSLGKQPVRHDLRQLDALLDGSPPHPQQYMMLVKGAYKAWPYVSSDAVTRWMVGRAAAVLHDESGPAPRAYGTQDWRVRGFGDFERVEGSCACTMA